jgi:hypothetical protein
MPQLFVYRNRPDDDRGPDELHFCSHCNGWYGVSHDNSHCQEDRPAGGRSQKDCACRFCKEAEGRAPTGEYGFFTGLKKWQPPKSILDK